MDNIEEIKKRIKNKKYDYKQEADIKVKYVNNLITRLLISIIAFFSTLILINTNKDIKSFIKGDILNNNISFTKISNIYNKYLGNIIPINTLGTDTKTVFNEKITYTNIKEYKNGYELEVQENYLVPVINSGIVVFVGEKEDYGNTVIIQGIDEIEYWYGNVDNLSVSMYDYVSKGSMLGNSKSNKLYLVFQKEKDFIGYDDIL